jgi:uncharacterized membrane protein YhhN
MTRMNATLRRTFGWLAAVLLNVGALMVALGLLLPRTDSGVPVLAVGVVLCVVGLAAGAAWMAGARKQA